MSRWSERTVERKGGIDAESWLNRFYITPIRDIQEQVQLVRSDGQIETKSSSYACLIMTKLTEEFKENKSNIRGNAPQVIGTPLAQLCEYGDSQRALYQNKPHTLIQDLNTAVAIPLMFPSSSEDQILFKEAARKFLSCGRADIDHSDQHVGLMMLYTMKSLILTLVKEQTQELQTLWFKHLIRVIQVADRYFSKFPDAFLVIDPLREDDDTNDVLIRACAFVYFQQTWSREQLWRILEVTLKRYCKHHRKENKGQAVDFVTNPMIGAVACLLVIPLLRDILAKRMSPDAATLRLNEALVGQIEVIAQNGTTSIDILNEHLLTDLLRYSDLEKTAQTTQQLQTWTHQLYEYCVNPCHLITFAPLEEWGIIPPQVIPFTYITQGLTIKKNKVSNTVRIKCLDTLLDSALPTIKLTVNSSGATDWSAFGLVDPGTYRFKPSLVGAAKAGVGSTLGDVNNANIRFTTGLEILPNQIEGRASTGKHYTSRNGTWNYYDTTGLDLTSAQRKEIVVTIEKTPSSTNTQRVSTFDVRQDGPFFQGTIRGTTPLLIAFKFIKFDLTFEPPISLERIQQEHRMDTDLLVQQAASLQGLSGHALLEKLAQLKLAEKTNNTQGFTTSTSKNSNSAPLSPSQHVEKKSKSEDIEGEEEWVKSF
ncbi:MAG: hypothetical protein Sylvanvirus14_21 [Sylvanvirus sp.]|uniref:Uncharacterized protein n=1 Tax=Sylvanvirus sp. TaxID=2487774 RepID=A0A3G5AID8_9VIRU|nr:MAG: hypothetical protein Sylvanvirus14_21 [Sylvanvirus sp.]